MSDLRKAVIRLAHENPDIRAELLPLLKEAGPEKTAKYQTVRPTRTTGRPGNANYFKMLSNLNDLMDAAEIQAGQIETQARLMQKGDPMDADWTPTQEWALELSNKLHALRRNLPNRPPA
jgi:hypothetical protein